MEITRFSLFPSLVLNAKNPDHETIKEKTSSQLMNFIGPEGYSGEVRSPMDMHHNPHFLGLYQFITLVAQEFMKTLSLDPNDFNFNITKSWMNSIINHTIPLHSHPDAHLSCVYYMNVPENAAHKLIFYNNINRHEPYPGCIKMNKPKEWTPLNSYTWSFLPEEGNLFMFSSNINHSVDGPGLDEPPVESMEELMTRRISIATDIILTYKNPERRSIGFQPTSVWKTF